MQRTGNHSRGIAALRQIKAHLAIHEIHHTLGGSCLFPVALQPAGALQLFLIFHEPQGTVASHILGVHLHHHAAVAPCRAAIGGRHSVDDNLLRTGSCRNDKASGTHAEGIDTTAVHLRDEGIFGCRQIVATAVSAMVLYLVYQLTGMFQAHTDGQPLCLNLNAGLVQIAIDIASRMSSSKNDGTGISNE